MVAIIYLIVMEILKFYSPTCGPCKVVENKLTEEGIEHTNVDVTLKENEDALHKYNITTIPTIVVIDGNKLVRKYNGIPTAEQFKTIRELCNIL